MDLLKGLNKEQQEAVLHTEGPLLILAGAGSGKTRVLTHRIAHLIKDKGVYPSSILAITFTNKAAREMKERTEKLLGDEAADMWISTFHSICVRILRRDIEKLGYSRSFVIFDSADQQTVIKDCLKELNLNEKNFPYREVQAIIGRAKDELIEPEVYTRANASDFRLGKVAKIYELYQKKLKNNNALDFDDIILLTIKLFLDNPPVLQYYQHKFRYVLVDEYQDTNTAQYTLVSLLAQGYRNLCVVGDDDQCIVEGSGIHTPDGVYNIEHIKEGQEILSAAGHGKTMTGLADKVLVKNYQGTIVKVITKTGKVIRGTPNHIGFARINAQPGVYYIYLMYKKDLGYRIGQTQGVRSRNGEIVNGLFVRLNQEHGDKMWILHITQNREQAAFLEQLYAFKYGIPTTVFHGCGRGITLTQPYINAIFESIDTDTAADKLLNDLFMFREFPHHVCNAVIRGQSFRQIVNVTAFAGRKTGNDAGWHSHRICLNTSGKELRERAYMASFPTREGNRNTWRIETERKEYDEADIYANKISQIDCNIEIIKKAKLSSGDSFSYMPLSHMKPSMSIAVFNGHEIVEDIIESVEFDEYSGKVYDISVPHFRQYICDGIVIHNSIYGWRGANIRNILDFEKEFKGCKVVKLEQNYRSTRTILDAANNVIKNNTGRKIKSMWTENLKGDGVQLFETGNEHEEAAFIAGEIERLRKLENRSFRDFAILYRINAQSRVLEDNLMKQGIAYRIFGGLRFYDRKEIKDIIAYLRLILNPSDDIALKRVINVPKRGIGNTTVDNAESIALGKGSGIFDIISSAGEFGELQRAASKLTAFAEMINGFRTLAEGMDVSELIQEVIGKSGILAELKEENTVEAETRIENIKELISGAMEFEAQSEEKGLEAYLANVSLVSDIDSMEGEKDYVALMTLHSAKGLEFPVVFMAGMEEGVFPGFRSMGDDNELEEERRLCYVGMTRARERLYMTSTFSRTLFGNTTYNKASRFIKEIPAEFIEAQEKPEKKQDSFTGWRDRPSVTSGFGPAAAPASYFTAAPQKTAEGFNLKVGDSVVHKKFGVGKITLVEKENDDYKLEIQFKNAGMKRLMAAYANLTKL